MISNIQFVFCGSCYKMHRIVCSLFYGLNHMLNKPDLVGGFNLNKDIVVCLLLVFFLGHYKEFTLYVPVQMLISYHSCLMISP